MTEQYTPYPTFDLQLQCLDVFMLTLGYVPYKNVKYSNHNQTSIFSFATALRLFKETTWEVKSAKWVAPSFNTDIRLPRFLVDCATACKPVHRVKLTTNDQGIIVCTSDKLEFTKEGYDKIFLKKPKPVKEEA